MPRSSLTPDEARRAALAAQGFGRRAVVTIAGSGELHRGPVADGTGTRAAIAAPRVPVAGIRPPAGPAAQPAPTQRGSEPGTRAITQLVRRLGAVQIDSVNVLSRAHYLPVFSRLGPYGRGLLDAASARAPRSLFEYWGHEAALLPVSSHPLLRWRMERAHREAWGGMRRVLRENPGLVDEVAAVVRTRGPLTITELERELAHVEQGSTDHWGWNWSNVKRAVEYLFWSGEITSAGRDSTFRRRYAAVDQVIPRAVLDAPTPTEADARRELVRIAARAQGVATRADLADYFRISQAEAAQAIADLLDAGSLVQVAVPGWPAAYAVPDLRVPRAVEHAALLAPFDPLIWFRARTERIFAMRYRIGIYTPVHKREYGYYVLPFLHAGHMVARVDLKADRAAGRLLVQSAHAQAGCSGEAVEALAGELRSMAGWLGLGEVEVVQAGDLATRLGAALA